MSGEEEDEGGGRVTKCSDVPWSSMSCALEQHVMCPGAACHVPWSSMSCALEQHVMCPGAACHVPWSSMSCALQCSSGSGEQRICVGTVHSFTSCPEGCPYF